MTLMTLERWSQPLPKDGAKQGESTKGKFSLLQNHAGTGKVTWWTEKDSVIGRNGHAGGQKKIARWTRLKIMRGTEKNTRTGQGMSL